MKFFVVGSMQFFNHGSFAYGNFICSNIHHQQTSGFSSDQCAVNKPKGYLTKLKRMRASKALQIGLCRSNYGYLFAPETDIIRTSAKDVARLNMFVVVLKEWIDFNDRLVIIPDKMPIKIGDRVQHSQPTKCIFDTDEDDYQYFKSCKTDMLANRNKWGEFSFNSCVGPFMTLAEAVSVRKNMNRMFVDDKNSFKARLKKTNTLVR